MIQFADIMQICDAWNPWKNNWNWIQTVVELSDWTFEYWCVLDVIESLIPGPTRGPPPEDMVRSSANNTERMEPSHDIKDIIKQHQPAGTTTSTGPATQK